MNTIFWFRRDLRLYDNVGLNFALKENKNVIPIFIFDKQILDELPKDDRRVSFIYDRLKEIKEKLNKTGSDLIVRYGEPEKVFSDLIDEFNISSVYTNNDYEPYALDRDNKIKEFLEENQIVFKSYKDQVIFEKDEIVKDDGEPYLVYTPYSKQWKKNIDKDSFNNHSVNKYKDSFAKIDEITELIELSDMGFKKVDYKLYPEEVESELIENYEETRNYPAKNGTSNMSLHLRFGTVSVRELASKAKEHNEKYLNELIWREFFMTILYHYPETIDNNFRAKYDSLEWRNNEEEFEKWCKGETGFPLVDAGMRQLNESGYMHNRVRMVVANFLTKLLLIDWRWGEQYFAKKLMDYEMSSNVGNWQWAAGTGVDAAPYFRIFRPELQVEKYDKDLEYIKKWIPDYEENYIEPIIDYKSARQRALDAFKKATEDK